MNSRHPLCAEFFITSPLALWWMKRHGLDRLCGGNGQSEEGSPPKWRLSIPSTYSAWFAFFCMFTVKTRIWYFSRPSVQSLIHCQTTLHCSSSLIHQNLATVHFPILPTYFALHFSAYLLPVSILSVIFLLSWRETIINYFISLASETHYNIVPAILCLAILLFLYLKSNSNTEHIILWVSKAVL